MTTKCTFYTCCILLCTLVISCKKDKTAEDFINKATQKTITYVVKGNRIKMNFIDSNSVFQSNKLYENSFTYQFRKGSGASIGISVSKQSPTDTIYSWSIYINDKVSANAFSEGGAYFTVPYN